MYVFTLIFNWPYAVKPEHYKPNWNYYRYILRVNLSDINSVFRTIAIFLIYNSANSILYLLR